MFDAILEPLRPNATALAAAGCGSLLVWSFSIVVAARRTGRLPGRIASLGFWFVGAWMTAAATSVVLFLGIRTGAWAFLVGGAVARLAGFIAEDSDLEAAHARFDRAANAETPAVQTADPRSTSREAA